MGGVPFSLLVWIQGRAGVSPEVPPKSPKSVQNRGTPFFDPLSGTLQDFGVPPRRFGRSEAVFSPSTILGGKNRTFSPDLVWGYPKILQGSKNRVFRGGLRLAHGTPQQRVLRLGFRFLPKSVHRVPPSPVYIGYPPSPMYIIIESYWKIFVNFIGGLHPAFLKSAADGPRAGRYTDSSGARRRRGCEGI